MRYAKRFKLKRKATFLPIYEARYEPRNLLFCSKIAARQEMSPIHNSHLAFELLKSHFNPDAEEFWLINLNCTLTTKQLVLIAKGTLNYCSVHPRDLFREALRANSYAMIIAHNHPSLDPSPTPQDIKLTRRLCQIGRIIEVPILDHIVFTDKKYFSFKENKLI